MGSEAPIQIAIKLTLLIGRPRSVPEFPTSLAFLTIPNFPCWSFFIYVITLMHNILYKERYHYILNYVMHYLLMYLHYYLLNSPLPNPLMVEGRPTRPSNESLFLFFNGWEYFHEKDGFLTSSDCLEKFHN